MREERYLSARRAAEELGVSVATLYAYVSRGMVRSEAVEGKKRNRRYRAEYNLHRLALHAHQIEFDHPVTQSRVSVTAPVPDDLGLALAMPLIFGHHYIDRCGRSGAG